MPEAPRIWRNRNEYLGFRPKSEFVSEGVQTVLGFGSSIYILNKNGSLEKTTRLKIQNGNRNLEFNSKSMKSTTTVVYQTSS